MQIAESAEELVAARGLNPLEYHRAKWQMQRGGGANAHRIKSISGPSHN
jgi:hypothetical protein